MKIWLKKYLRFWCWVDLLGLGVSLILASTYLLESEEVGEAVKNLWSNLAVEVFGVWLSVRVIDYLIQRHRNFKQARFDQLKNLEFSENIASHILRYSPSYQRDIEVLERELKYFDKRWIKREKHFYNDEREQILELRQLLPEILNTCKELELNGDQEQNRTHFKILKENLRVQLYDYRIKLEKLRENIWEESHPDD